MSESFPKDPRGTEVLRIITFAKCYQHVGLDRDKAFLNIVYIHICTQHYTSAQMKFFDMEHRL